MNRLYRALLLLAAATGVGLPHAAHAGLRTTPNLTSVTIQEVTGVTTAHPFLPNGPELTAQQPGALGVGNNDFTGTPTEFYDVYYSDANGVFALDGNFLSVECRFDQATG